MDAWERAVAHVAARSAGPPLPADARVVVHFHPDRRHDGVRVVERLADGAYLSQFSTGISNGGLTARPGGDRWRWESRMFGGAYDDAPAEERPVYGAVEHAGRGGALRFGSSWLELAPSTRRRVTLCWPDSAFAPSRFGTPDRAGDLLALADAAAEGRDPLDDYVEAHLHGGLDLARDVARLVLDPAYRGTRVERAAAALPVPLAWSEGRVLEVRELEGREGYRGPAAADLARALARHGRLDARLLGTAAARGELDPQLLKQAWHLVARFGHPAATSAG